MQVMWRKRINRLYGINEHVFRIDNCRFTLKKIPFSENFVLNYIVFDGRLITYSEKIELVSIDLRAAKKEAKKYIDVYIRLKEQGEGVCARLS